MFSAYNNLKLANKILLPTTLTVGLIMILFTIYLIGELERDEKAQLNAKADMLASLLSSTAADDVWNYDAAAVQAIAESFFIVDDVVQIAIFGSNKEELFTLNMSEKDTIHNLERTADIDYMGTVIGNVHVTLTSHHIDEALSELRTKLDFLVVVIFSVLIFVISVISKFTFKPLAHLLVGIRELSKGNYQYQVKVNAKDELGQVADQFNSMSTKIVALQQSAVTAAKISKEMQIATEIQTALQPSSSALTQKNYEIAARMEPAEEVGGDYYDCIRDVDGRLWFGIGDVTGHGLLSGLIMMMAQVATNTLLKSIANMTPVDLLIAINKVIHANVKAGLYSDHHMTINFLVEVDDGIFNFAGAHESILIYRANTGETELVDTKGMWLGIIPDIEKQTIKGAGSFSLQKNDVCLIYTDGVIEIMNEHREQYDVGRLTEFLKRYARNTNMNELVALLYQELMDFKHQQLDDITYLFFKKQ